MNHKINRLLSFDYGTQKIGVATGQRVTKTAQPLEQIKVSNGKPNWNAIANLVKEWQPDAIVVGLPLNMDGSEQQITKLAKKFARQIEGRFNQKIYYQDERLTSVGARSEIFEREGYRGMKSRSIDSLAACLILEDWFNIDV